MEATSRAYNVPSVPSTGLDGSRINLLFSSLVLIDRLLELDADTRCLEARWLGGEDTGEQQENEFHHPEDA